MRCDKHILGLVELSPGLHHKRIKMIKAMSAFILSLLLITIVLFWFRPHSKFLLTIFPPSNLYIPLVKQSITLKEKTVYQYLRLTHDYVGTYLVGVYIKKPPPFGTPIVSNAELCLSIRKGENLLFEKKFARWASRFGGPGEKESGVIFGFYKVPDNVPLGLATQAILSIKSPDPAFEENYGDVDFFIRKKSDQ